MICNRDIIVDKGFFHMLSNLDLSQLTIELMIDISYNIPHLNTITQITEVESDKDKFYTNTFDTANIPLLKSPKLFTLETFQAKKISADLDKTNILLKKITKKKQVYTVKFQQFSQSQLNRYHMAFSTFITLNSQ